MFDNLCIVECAVRSETFVVAAHTTMAFYKELQKYHALNSGYGVKISVSNKNMKLLIKFFYLFTV